MKSNVRHASGGIWRSVSSKRSRNAVKFLFFLLFTVFGAAVGNGVGKWLKASGPQMPVTAWHLVLIPVLLFLTIAWHEFGHVVGGWLSGFRLTLFIVGPLRIERSHDVLQLRLNRSLALAGGLAACIPRPGTPVDPPVMKRALLRIVAGGPIFSLAGGFLLLPAWVLMGTAPQFAILLGLTSALSLLIAMATLIPLPAGAFRSDGARILQLLRGGGSADRWASLGLLATYTYTMRPRDWPRDMVLAAAKQGERGFDAVSAAWLRSCHHVDRGELDDAKLWIEEALAGQDEWPKPAHSTLHATAAYVYAISREPSLAREHFNQLKTSGLVPKEQVLYTKAYVLQAEGEKQAALEAARNALALIPPSAQGAAAFQREDLEQVIAQCSSHPA